MNIISTLTIFKQIKARILKSFQFFFKIFIALLFRILFLILFIFLNIDLSFLEAEFESEMNNSENTWNTWNSSLYIGLPLFIGSAALVIYSPIILGYIFYNIGDSTIFSDLSTSASSSTINSVGQNLDENIANKINTFANSNITQIRTEVKETLDCMLNLIETNNSLNNNSLNNSATTFAEIINETRNTGLNSETIVSKISDIGVGATNSVFQLFQQNLNNGILLIKDVEIINQEVLETACVNISVNARDWICMHDFIEPLFHKITIPKTMYPLYYQVLKDVNSFSFMVPASVDFQTLKPFIEATHNSLNLLTYSELSIKNISLERFCAFEKIITKYVSMCQLGLNNPLFNEGTLNESTLMVIKEMSEELLKVFKKG